MVKFFRNNIRLKINNKQKAKQKTLIWKFKSCSQTTCE